MARRQRGPCVSQVAPRASGASVLVRYRQPAVPHRYRHAGRPGAVRGKHRPPAAVACGPCTRGRRMTDAARSGTLRLTLARACAWGLLIAGWIGIGGLALQSTAALSNGVASGFALVALWLLAIGAGGPARHAPGR